MSRVFQEAAKQHVAPNVKEINGRTFQIVHPNFNQGR